MRAIVIARPGGGEVLELRELPAPEPGLEQVLVRVRAAGVNRADIHQREGNYPAPPGVPADVPGIEFAGEVAALGPGARGWRVGQRVFGVIGGGAYAEYVVSHERMLVAVPDALSWDEAGGAPEAFITAHDALVANAALRSGERVLVHAAGSGVGLCAVQVARAMGATPYGTARAASKIEAARRLGLEDGIVIQDGSLDVIAERAAAWTLGAGLDVALDLVGGPYTPATIPALAVRGRLILIGTVAGRRAELPLGTILGRRLTLRGTVLRARPLEEKIAATQAFAREVVPLLARGTLRSVIDSVFPLERARDAHERVESNGTIGRVVLRVA